jgi:peptidoglycan/LPS O-acetylase OafA/YrhL
MTPSRPPRGWRRLVAKLLVLMALGYLAGVGISYAFDRTDPWISGLSATGPVLGGAVGSALVRRSRGNRPG